VEDYPRNLAEFEARFSTEAACREYLVRLRWPDGFRCPRCGGRKDWPVRGLLRQCADCGYQSSVTAGTIFQDTRKPLMVWFRAMWAVTSQKNGASAIGLQRVLGLGSYDTAWTWLHKLRRAMVRPGRDRLSGRVEVDETYWGSEEEGVRGRQTESKALIVIAAQKDGDGIGRIRMRRIPDASTLSMLWATSNSHIRMEAKRTALESIVQKQPAEPVESAQNHASLPTATQQIEGEYPQKSPQSGDLGKVCGGKKGRKSLKRIGSPSATLVRNREWRNSVRTNSPRC
jgi:hypothetical protein